MEGSQPGGRAGRQLSECRALGAPRPRGVMEMRLEDGEESHQRVLDAILRNLRAMVADEPSKIWATHEGFRRGRNSVKDPGLGSGRTQGSRPVVSLSAGGPSVLALLM